jgi:hypothetical protein
VAARDRPTRRPAPLRGRRPTAARADSAAADQDFSLPGLARKWAYWLRDTIPGATSVVEIDGARLFFPDERATELTAALHRHWNAHPRDGLFVSFFMVARLAAALRPPDQPRACGYSPAALNRNQDQPRCGSDGSTRPHLLW